MNRPVLKLTQASSSYFSGVKLFIFEGKSSRAVLRCSMWWHMCWHVRTAVIEVQRRSPGRREWRCSPAGNLQVRSSRPLEAAGSRQVTSGSVGHCWMASTASLSGVKAAPAPTCRHLKLASKLLVLKVDHLNVAFQALLRWCLFKKK